MKDTIKKIFPVLPRWVRFILYKAYEEFFALISFIKTGKILILKRKDNGIKKNILFYHLFGLGFGGTEKSLQIIAKFLDKNKYNVFFMYSAKPIRHANGVNRLDGRKAYLENSNVELIEFDYKGIDGTYPYTIRGQKPSIFNVINDKKIDILFTAGSGYSDFPINLIRNIPILMMNIFGSPSTQKNIVKHICISEEVRNKILPVVNINKTETLYIQSELPPQNTLEFGDKIREQFNINKSDMVFGRIGRPDDNIFDPIGIDAFKKVVSKYPNAHYIIMAPAPILIKKINDDNIKNIHLIKPSSDEKDIWGFHQSVDCLAHFRKDGESCGLNIAESMLCGKPIISHRSRQWNAHLEYLDKDFSRIAEIDDVNQYADFMIEMIKAKETGKIQNMGRKAKVKAEKLFYIKNNINHIHDYIDSALKQ